MNNEKLVTDYLAALAEMKTGKDLANFFHKDVEQIEYPNALVPHGTTRDLDMLLESAARGKKLMKEQTYKIKNIVTEGETIVVEVKWTGKLSSQMGDLKEGDKMKAHFAMVIELRDGLVWRQRNYDCFKPF